MTYLRIKRFERRITLTTTDRYVVKVNNGGFKVFDTLRQADVSLHTTRSAAEAALRCELPTDAAKPAA